VSRPRPWAPAAGLVLAAIALTVTIGVARRGSDERARCGPGFVAHASRCVPAGDTCPSPLARGSFGCDAPDVRVSVPETTLVLGPSDWEAEGRVAPRTVHAGPFRADAFEVTRGAWTRATGGAVAGEDAARAASGMTRDEAAAFCARRAPGGRLPTEDEWIVAAVAGASVPPRYPWGDTGAVCRRAAWGLLTGPCADAADGPDTVGAHPDGDSALGIHDLAGNVAEWLAPGGEWAMPAGSGASVRVDSGVGGGGVGGGGVGGVGGVAKGGSWETALATELRVWARLELDPRSRDPRVGFRCVYPA
jgi:formylglycine-generating enzyme required for sulfatase activity